MKIDINVKHSHECYHNCVSCVVEKSNEFLNELLKKKKGVIFTKDAKNYPSKEEIETFRNDELLRKTKDDALRNNTFYGGDFNCKDKHNAETAIELSGIVDNGTTEVTVGRVLHNGKDITDEYFGKKKDIIFHEGKGNCGECCSNCGYCRYGA